MIDREASAARYRSRSQAQSEIVRPTQRRAILLSASLAVVTTNGLGIPGTFRVHCVTVKLGDLLVGHPDRASLASNLRSQLVPASAASESREPVELVFRFRKLAFGGVSGLQRRQPLVAVQPEAGSVTLCGLWALDLNARSVSRPG